MADRSININRQQQQKIRNAIADYQSKSGNSIQFIEMGGNVPFTLSSPTPSPTPAVTVTPTSSPTPSVTPSSTSTPSNTSIPTTTPSSTSTPTPSVTPSSTSTPTPSPSLTPSVTQTIPANTFNVTANGSSAYIINGQSNPTLSINEGETYTFNINASGHPFWIKTVNSTGTGNAYNDGVTNNGTANGTITFVVPYNAPSTLYYNCQYHSSMAGTINVTDVPSPTATPNPTPTPSPT